MGRFIDLHARFSYGIRISLPGGRVLHLNVIRSNSWYKNEIWRAGDKDARFWCLRVLGVLYGASLTRNLYPEEGESQ